MDWTAFQTEALFVGATAGVAADIAQDILQAGLVKMELIEITLDQFAAAMFVRRGSTELFHEIPLEILGFLAGMALSVILGILFVYLVRYSGGRFIIVKGLVFGMALWLLIYGGLHAGLHMSYLQDYDPVHTLIQLPVHLFFGFCLGVTVEKVSRFHPRQE